MQIRFFRLTSLAAFLCIGVLVAAGAARAGSYTFTTLDDPGGVGYTYAAGINAGGTIVGSYNDSSYNFHGFLYSGGSYTTMDDPDGSNTKVGGINDNGDIVGYYTINSTGGRTGFLYNGSTYTTISFPTATIETEAFGVNKSGEIVGHYQDSSGIHGFLYSGGKFTTIDDPNGVGDTQAFGINDSGDIVGYYGDSSGLEHGFLYNGKTGAYTTLDDPNASGITDAFAINNNGDIVGSYYDSSFDIHGFLYSRGVYTTIDAPGAKNTNPVGIDDSGDIVGYYSASKGLDHGFLATPAGGLWQNAVATGGGWYYLSWFGSFNTNSSPWIYHYTLGWLYPIGTSTSSIWFYDPQWDGAGGWWWTGSSLFPWVYSVSEGEWLYFDAQDSTPGARWFFTSGGRASTH